MKNTPLAEALAFDAFNEAEKLAGRNTEASNYLGLSLHLEATKNKKALLIEAQDSHSSTTLEEYLEIVARLGFEIVKIEDFEKESTYLWMNDKKKQISTPYTKTSQLYILWNSEKSILMVFDTSSQYNINEKENIVFFESAKINSGHIYYNWIPNDPKSKYDVTSSGSYYKEKGVSWDDLTEYIWVGDHDLRDAIAHKVTNLSEHGTFLKKWKSIPFCSMLHHLEWKLDYRNGLDSNEVTINRVKSLPIGILDCIGSIEDRLRH